MTLPGLKQLTKSAYSGMLSGKTSGAWTRWADAEWLGPFTPHDIPHWIRKLMRRDPQIALGLTAIKAPFFGIEYRLENGNPETRAFIESTLLKRSTFETLLWSILNSLDFGFQAHEAVYAVRDVDIDEDGPGGLEPRTIKRAYVYDRIIDLDPERTSIEVDTNGRLAAVRVDGAGRIPADKCILASHNPEYQNWHGESILDRAYNAWYWSNHIYLFAMRYLESKGNPPLVGYAPSKDGPLFDEDKSIGQDGADPLDVLAEHMMALRGGGAISMPGETDDKGVRLWSVSELQHAPRGDQFLIFLQHLNDLKLRALLVPERVVTQDTSVGSFAMAETHLDVFLSNMEGLKRRLVLFTFNDDHCGIIPRLIKFNFGADAPVPRLAGSELSRQSKQLLSDILRQALEVPRTLEDGSTYTTAGLIDDIRALEALNIPHRKPKDVATAPTKARAEAIDVRGEEMPAAVSDTALNGAQIQALKDLIGSVTSGELPASSAQELIAVSFPSIDSDTARRIVEPAAKMSAPSRGDDPAADRPAPPTAAELAAYPESAAAAAERYGVGAATVRRWVTLGAPCLRLPGGRMRFCAEALDAWIHKRGQSPKRKPTKR